MSNGLDAARLHQNLQLMCMALRTCLELLKTTQCATVRIDIHVISPTSSEVQKCVEPLRFASLIQDHPVRPVLISCPVKTQINPSIVNMVSFMRLFLFNSAILSATTPEKRATIETVLDDD